MPRGTHLVSASDLAENESYLFTVRELDGSEEEVILVKTATCIAAWKNFCQHETDQRLDRGMGAAMRDGEIICPKHGSMFDGCSGYCDNGKAAESTLVEVDVTVEDGDVYLTDAKCRFLHEGGLDDGDDMPSSSSHLSF
ncbi:Rieske (2Fe-2S) protein [Haladaptatus sp. GCM10025707]|uniref:Rieske (2Fe-2S) protein n=1 Tax=unclassified Haladaptatus TaxID=2622732 RepID=UPI0023E7A978|nr:MULTISPECIES: Rieske 2Fe-2S domain-containing protein [unclassified Haladaptatus]